MTKFVIIIIMIFLSVSSVALFCTIEKSQELKGNYNSFEDCYDPELIKGERIFCMMTQTAKESVNGK